MEDIFASGDKDFASFVSLPHTLTPSHPHLPPYSVWPYPRTGPFRDGSEGNGITEVRIITQITIHNTTNDKKVTHASHNYVRCLHEWYSVYTWWCIHTAHVCGMLQLVCYECISVQENTCPLVVVLCSETTILQQVHLFIVVATLSGRKCDFLVVRALPG